jgi:HEAT repeat protein
MRKVIENAQRTATAVPREVALRVLWLLDKVSDCSRVTPYLIQLTRHPGSEVRSKSALLLGRGNLNMGRLKQFLGSEDGRTRANAVESLWGLNSPQARDLFNGAASDPNRRVAVNALVGLCKAGDRTAHSKLMRLAGSEDPLSRLAASWAMGQVGDPEFITTLEALAQDDNKVVRTMATRSLDLVQFPVPNRRAAQELPQAKPAPPNAGNSFLQEYCGPAIL